jgi:hypothetical protein
MCTKNLFLPVYGRISLWFHGNLDKICVIITEFVVGYLIALSVTAVLQYGKLHFVMILILLADFLKRQNARMLLADKGTHCEMYSVTRNRRFSVSYSWPNWFGACSTNCLSPPCCSLCES